MASIYRVDIETLKKFGEARVPKPECHTSVSADSSSRIQTTLAKPQAVAVCDGPLPQTYAPQTYAQHLHPNFAEVREQKSMLFELWNLEAERAHQIYNVAIVGLMTGAFITMTSIIVLVWISGIKTTLATTHYRMAVAASDRAKADAAKANERAAEFLLRAQEARGEQEKAHLQLERVRNLNAGRRVTPDQSAKILNILRGHPMKVVLLSSSEDKEASLFAADIARVLSEAGASVRMEKSFLPIPITGLGMSMSNSASASTLFMAFRSADFEITDLPDKNPVMIVVGSNPTMPF